LAVKTKILFSLWGVALIAALAGCGGQSASTPAAPHGAMQNPPTKQSSTQLVIVSPHSDSIRAEFERAFKAKHPEVSIQWLNPGASSELLRFVLDQFKAKKNKDEGIGVDLFFGGGPETFIELDESGLLQKLPSDYKVPPALNGVPLRAKNNEWVGAALSGFGILYNKTIATRDHLPIPVTWADLGKKELLGRIELADPRKSGSAHVAYEIILQTNGWENGWKILAAMAGNSRAFIDSSSTLVNDVSSGEAVFVPAIDFYARAKIAASGKVKAGYVEPKGQSVVTPDPIGILRGAKNKKLAQEFVAFVLSPEGQKLWMLDKGAPGGPHAEALFRMGILPSLYQPLAKGSLITSNPFAVKNARSYNSAKAAARRQVLDDLIGATLIDNHDGLVGRQRAFGDLNQMMLAPSEQDVTEASKQWGNAEFAQKKLGAWRDAAREKIS
jgi:ABC-type Fe3+ transport system substrate-binding protein